MSRTAVLGSNAIASTVAFYAAALEEAERRAASAELMAKHAMTSTVGNGKARLVRFEFDQYIKSSASSSQELAQLTILRDRVISILDGDRADRPEPDEEQVEPAGDAPRRG